MTLMRCLTIEPGVTGSLRLEEFKIPSTERGAILVLAVALGVCGTDHEMIAGKYGDPPPGHRRLIIGHESFGRVEQAPPGSGLVAGQPVVGIVRHPDPVPCPSCAAGEWDMCRNGRYTEHGIKALDGFGSEFYRLDEPFVVPVPESLGLAAVLVEPATIVTKAWREIDHIGRRARWSPKKVLVTGAGPVGLLAALLAAQRGLDVHVFDRAEDGPKPDLVRGLGARYQTGAFEALDDDFDVVLECTAGSAIVAGAVEHTALDGIVCLLGVSSPGDTRGVDIGRLNRDVVLGNRVIFGSVNANRSHYLEAIDALNRADRAWLDRLITRRVPLATWESAFETQPDDVKTVLLFPDT